MKIESIRRDANKTLAYFDEHRGEGCEAGPAPILYSERMLEVADIAEKMTDEEFARIKSVPAYSDDMRSCKDIKEKYGLSWNELRIIRNIEK